MGREDGWEVERFSVFGVFGVVWVVRVSVGWLKVVLGCWSHGLGQDVSVCWVVWGCWGL
jgi:hypothetical protein